MKKYIFIMVMVLACNAMAMAQQARIAFFSYNAVLNSLPQYAEAQQALENSRSQYKAELQSSEQEFSDKYEMYLEQQATLDPAIKEKRQADIQDLYDRNMKFRQSSEALLRQQEADALATIKQRIMDAVAKVGSQGGYLMVVNTDSEACPYIDPACSTDVTQQIADIAKATK